MSFKGSLDKLMQQAQAMQEKMQSAQEELANMRVAGQAGAGLVKVTMNGRHEVINVEVDHEALEEDKEVLEDLIAAAVNDANNKIEETSRGKIADLANKMQVPQDLSDLFDGDDEEDK